MASKVESIRDRIKKIAAQSAPSMIPVPREDPAPPPAKEVEVVPTLAEVVTDVKARLEMARLIARHGELGMAIKPLEKERKSLTEIIKKKVGALGVGKMLAGDWRVSYYDAPRFSISKELLLAHGVSVDTIVACTVSKSAYTLKISQSIGDDKEDDNG